MTETVTVGIDTSKDRLDVAARPGDRFRVTNDPAGIADLVARLQALRPSLVVLEATGGYEADALAALLDRRRQLIGMRVAEGNRVRPGLPAAVRAGIEAHLAWLDEQVAAIDREVAAAVRRSPAWREEDRLPRSIKGVGPVVSRTLLADLPELGTRPPGKLAALAGLAPFAADGGRRRGERHIRGGRREVRRALYMGALAVARVPGPLRDFAQRLKARGKPSKVALIAVARKLLVIANAVIRDGRAWDPKLAAAA